MKIQISRQSIPINIFNSLRRSVGWKDVEEKNYNMAIINSIATVHALIDSQVVGFGRLIGDTGMYLYIQDLIVHSDYQKRGIGKILLNELQNIVKEMDSSSGSLILIADNTVTEFYKKLGFSDNKPESRFMIKTI